MRVKSFGPWCGLAGSEFLRLIGSSPPDFGQILVETEFLRAETRVSTMYVWNREPQGCQFFTIFINV